MLSGAWAALHAMTNSKKIAQCLVGVESEEQEARALQQAALGGQEEHRLIQQKVSAFKEQIAVQEQDCVAQEDCECSMFCVQPYVMHSHNP